MDFGGLTVTVEMAFGDGPFEASPTWEDVSSYVRAGQIRRGRSSVQSEFPAGTATLRLGNSDGRFYPWNTSGPYSPDITVGVPVRVTAEYDSTTYPVFYGYVGSNPAPFPTNTEELIQFECVELVGRLQRKEITRSFSATSSDVRIGALLNEAGWPAGLRDLGSGVADVAALETEAESVLDLLRKAVEVEQGQLFQARDGDLVFLNRVAPSQGTSQATFGPDGAELIYTDVSVDYDDDYLFNEALITGADLNEVTVIDATSAGAHGPSTYSSLNEQVPSLPVALNMAEWVVGKYKDVNPRIEGLTIDPAGDPDNLWPEVLGRELRDIITVEATYPGSATQLVQEVTVESVSHDFVAGDVWTVRYGCYPLSDLEQQDFWILGTSELGVSTRLA